ncbi:MAG: hypothetical protein ACOC0J_01195, partial [Myxococcota bacterium]
MTRQEDQIREAPTAKRPSLGAGDRALLRRFIKGEITFAQLEGMSADDALRLAESGHALFRSGRLKEARTIFEGLAAVNPLDPYPHQVLGAVCEREEESEEALRHYDVCLSLHSDNAWVLARRGELRISSGDLRGGVEDLSRACELDPEAKSMSTARASLILASISEAARREGAKARAGGAEGAGER